MNIDYLLSIINLYLKRENDTSRTNMTITKKNENVEFYINMKETDPSKTSFFIHEDILDYILSLYKDNVIIIDEKYEYDRNRDLGHYEVEFKNGRKLSFNDFSIKDINNIRNSLYNITINKDEIRLKFSDDFNYNYNYQNNLNYSYAGFTSFKAVLLISIFFFIVLIISLVFFMK